MTFAQKICMFNVDEIDPCMHINYFSSAAKTFHVTEQTIEEDENKKMQKM